MKKALLEKLKKLGILMLATACLVTANPIQVNATTETVEDSDSGDDEDEDTKGNQATGSTPQDGQENSGASENVSGEDDDSDTTTPVTEDNGVSSTSEFLIVGDCVPTPTANYGQKVHVILPIYNLGVETVTNLVITPTVSTKAEEWPFRLDTVGLVQCVDYVPASPNKDVAYANRREVEWDLVLRDDVLTGTYKLEFNVSYYRNGSIETANLYTYINTKGASGSGSLEATDGEKASNPRIIVTGFETNPKEVFAGDTFELTIHVQNTSKRTSVNNIMFSLEAAQEGTDENNTFAAFLPTSGSSTVFMDTIGSEQSADIKIEMTAKADLAQKPYVLEVKSEYEDSDNNQYTASSNVSIPIKQVAKYELSSFDVMPENINVGAESNVMFSIYNTGKTTLYNVQVTFKGDSISGGDTFLGKIEPGGTGNVDAMITGAAATMDEGIVKAVISYEDESGNKTEEEKEFTLFVQEEMMDDFAGEMELMDDMEGEGTNSSKWVIIVVVVVIVILAVVVIIVFLNLKKKKKNQTELNEELDDLLAEVEKERQEEQKEEEEQQEE
ncbi:MAG: hypothetical protein IJN92_03610 [Lachnospiraceae bacterium]|nr:hypothetical protein [Lachnospiraceae bacterium]